MKTSLFVSKLLRPLFAVALSFTLASINSAWAEETEATVEEPLTEPVTISEDYDSYSKNVSLLEYDADGDVAGVTVGDSTDIYEVSSTIKITDVGETSGYYVRGLYVNGTYTSTDDKSSSVDVFSGEIDITSVNGDVRGVALGGSKSTYTGENELSYFTDDSKIVVSSDNGTAFGIVNYYGTIDEINGYVSASSGDETADTINSGALLNFGYIDSVTGTLESYQTGSGMTRTISSAYFGKRAMINSITATVSAYGESGETTAIYCIGDIEYINSNVTATATTGSVYAVYCDNDDDGTAEGKIGTLSGSIDASSAGLSVAVYNESVIDVIDAKITSTSTAGSAYGIYSLYSVDGSDSIGSISGSIDVTAYSSAYGMRFDTGSATKVDGAYPIIGDIDAIVTVTSTNSIGYGIYNKAESLGNVAGSLTVVASSTAYGIANLASIENVSCDIDSYSSSSSAYGIYNIYSYSEMGDVSGSITATGYSTVMGIRNTGEMGDVDVDIDVSTIYYNNGSAYGIYLASSSSIGTIGGSITTTGSYSYGIYTTNTNTLTFKDGTSITSTNNYDDAYSIYSTASSLTLASAGTVTLVGDIEVNEGSGSLTIDSGTFVLNSSSDNTSTIAASSITINDGATLNLTISANNTITASTVTGSGTLILSAGANAASTSGTSYNLSSSYTVATGDVVSSKVTTYGGTYVDNVFTVSKVQTLKLDGGTTVTEVAENGILVVSDGDTSITMNFNSETVTYVSSVTTVTSNDYTVEGDDSYYIISFEDYLSNTLDDVSTIELAEAYYFDVENLVSGESVELIFYVGETTDDVDIAIFHCDDEGWADVTESGTISYNYDGEYLYVYVDSFSAYGYTLTSTIPEPSTATLSLLALAGLLARRRRNAA